MKKIKKAIALVAAVAMIVYCAPVFGAEEGSLSQRDNDISLSKYEEIKTACEYSQHNELVINEIFESTNEEYTYGDFKYRFGDGTIGGASLTDVVYISGYEGNDTDITIPNEINGYIVKGINIICSGHVAQIQKLTIPSTITCIGNFGISGFLSLESITVDKNNPKYYDVDGILYDRYGTLSHNGYEQMQGKTLVWYPAKKSGAYFTVPNDVLKIGNEAFCYCTNLIGVSIPQNTEIGLSINPFKGCTNLQYIDVDDNNTKCYDIDGVLFTYKFDNNIICYPAKKAGTSYDIPNGTQEIAMYAFDNSSLTNITIPDSVTDITYAFTNCTKIAEISIPNSVIKISGAFSGCSNLKNITIPSSVTTISSFTFYKCEKLSDIYVDKNNNTYYDIDGVLFKKYSGYSEETHSLICYPSGKVNTVYNIPKINAKIDISEYSFSDCNKLSKINVGNISFIDSYAFSDCTNLINITIPNSNTYIYNNAFHGCPNLTIYCNVGSTAEEYAKKNNIPYVYINSSSEVKPQITKVQPSDGQVAVNWTAVNGATNYAVYFYQGGKWTCAGTRTSTGMYVKNLTNGVKYGFAVKAYVNGAWTAVTSADIVYATPVGTSKPKITKAAPGNGQVALNWTAVSGASQYAVYYRSGSKWIDAGRTSALGKYVKGLTNGTKYAFAVKAYVNGAWTGISSSDIVYATPVSASAKPKITKTIIGNGQVGLNWTAVNGAAQYAVYYKYNGVWTLAGTTTAQGKYVRGLKNGVTYGFAVKAYVNGAWTAISSSDIVYAAPSAAKASLETDITDIEFTDIEPEIKF